MSLAMLARKSELAGPSKASASSSSPPRRFAGRRADSAFERRPTASLTRSWRAASSPRLHWSLPKVSMSLPVQRKCVARVG